jgi:hypothetical protein
MPEAEKNCIANVINCTDQTPIRKNVPHRALRSLLYNQAPPTAAEATVDLEMLRPDVSRHLQAVAARRAVVFLDDAVGWHGDAEHLAVDVSRAEGIACAFSAAEAGVCMTR